MKYFLIVRMIGGLLMLNRAEAGCCNENYWCDGDPSFHEQPNVSQPPNATEVTISWSEAHLNLAKCVDYFFVQYAPSNVNKTATGKFTMIPVTLERITSLDDWEEAMGPLLSKYIAKFEANYDQDYIIKVVAVDRGAGWGELEGRAIVEAKPIHYHSRPLMRPLPPPDPWKEIEENIKRKYPPEKCNKHKLCDTLALEWAQDVTQHVTRFALPYQDPKTLPPVDITDEDEAVKRYDEGKLHHLKRFQTNVTGVETRNDSLLVNVTLKFRLLRTSYLWQNFFSHGILSMYHTCGQALPMAIFDDVDLEDVEEIVPNGCKFKLTVQLSVSENRAKVSKVLMELKQEEFQFDTTWLTSHFHDLDQLWKEQKKILGTTLELVMEDAFTSAIQFNRPSIWQQRKFRQIDNQLLAAAAKKKNLT